MLQRASRSILFPYTTLFRSVARGGPSRCGRARCARSARWRRSAGLTLRRRVFGEVAEHRSEEHTPELQSQFNLVCTPLLEKKNTKVSPASSNLLIAPDTEIH